MHTIESQLKKLGLEEKEISVYLTLLTHGPSSVRKVAAVSGVNRGSTYDTLKSLRERGLVSHFHEDTKQHFIAEDPAKLKKLVTDRQEELQRVAGSIDDMIPELQSLFNKGGGKPVARYYEGPVGIQMILVDVLDTMSADEEKEYFVYSSSAVRDAGLYDAFPDFTEQRIARGIQVKTIALGPGGKTAGLDQRKWIPAVEGTPTYILIYDGKCAFISLGVSASLFGVVIENPGIYQTHKLLFDQQWKSLPTE